MKMNTNTLYLGLALITGALIPVQAATNAVFSKSTGSPLVAAVVVFIIGFIAMVVLTVAMKTPTPSVQQLRSVPWYGYAGGIIVATYVVMITILVPRIGVGAAIAFIVTGQIIAAVVIDHFGLFHVTVRTLDVSRISGIVLMIAGIYFVMKK
jgi:transporter family-2 protein